MESITGREELYPQAVHDLCASYKAVMELSLVESSKDQSLSEDCRKYFAEPWQLECIV